MVSSEASNRSKKVPRERLLYLEFVCFKTGLRWELSYGFPAHWVSESFSEAASGSSDVLKNKEEKKNPKLFKFNQLRPKPFLPVVNPKGRNYYA